MSQPGQHPTPTSEWFTLDDRATTRIKWGDKNVTLHRSPTGRSFRIFVNGKEWKPDLMRDARAEITALRQALYRTALLVNEESEGVTLDHESGQAYIAIEAEP